MDEHKAYYGAGSGKPTNFSLDFNSIKDDSIKANGIIYDSIGFNVYMIFI